MKGKTFIIAGMVVLLFVTSIGAWPGASQAVEDEELIKYYNDYILKCISKSQSKTILQTSRSENLQSCGALSKQKVIFLKENQDMLVDEMIKNRIGMKPYKIEYYLNKRFYETQKQ